MGTPEKPTPDEQAQLKKALYDFASQGSPMEPDLYREFVTGDNNGLVAELLRDKSLDIKNPQVKERLVQILLDTSKHTLSAQENQPMGQGFHQG